MRIVLGCNLGRLLKIERGAGVRRPRPDHWGSKSCDPTDERRRGRHIGQNEQPYDLHDTDGRQDDGGNRIPGRTEHSA